MRVLIAGIDGYLGWPLALYLANRGHVVGGCDIFFRRQWVDEMGSKSAIPIKSINQRQQAFEQKFGQPLFFQEGNLTDYDFVLNLIRSFQPDTIVHLGEMPSAPYSMIDVNHCVFTQTNNLVGTLNLLHAIRETDRRIHLVKLGTMGEYGTPNIDIPEGFFEIEFRGRKDRLPFPRQAGSWYHQTKVHDSNNIMMACNIWGLKATDIMQGIVFGTRIDQMGDDDNLKTRFDIDQCFGTAINRFCAQAVLEQGITLYGKGHQKRGFLPLRDSMQCLTISVENPARDGEYRVFNQFADVYSLTDLAYRIQYAASQKGLNTEIIHLENPRVEKEEHYFNPDHQHLFDLGYVPSNNIEKELEIILSDLLEHKKRIMDVSSALIPDIFWTRPSRKAKSTNNLITPREKSSCAGSLQAVAALSAPTS